MDAKITKSRLGLLLSYDWIKIIGICLAAVLIWALLYTMLATRATNGQKFEIYSYVDVRMDSSVLGSLDDMHAGKALSNDVLDFSTYSLNQDGYEDMILQAHFSAGQGDVMFVPDLASTTAGDGTVPYAGLTDFLASYRSNAIWLGENGYEEGGKVVYEKNYFTQCEEYLGKFFKDASGAADFAEGTLDKAAAETNFRARIKGDKRYKNEAQRLEALEKEYERLEALRYSYCQVLDWVSNDSAEDPIELCKTTVTGQDESGAEVTLNWTYAFDLSNLEELTKFVSRPAEEGEIDGVSAGTYVSDKMCMVVLNGGSTGEEDMRYEPFTFMTYLVEKFDKKEA